MRRCLAILALVAAGTVAAGTFAYHCAIHPDMLGTVRVGG